MNKYKYMTRKKIESTAKLQTQQIDDLKRTMAAKDEAHGQLYKVAKLLAVTTLHYLSLCGDAPGDVGEEALHVAKQMGITEDNATELYNKLCDEIASLKEKEPCQN